MILLKIYANWCPHCIIMQNEWNVLKKMLPKYVDVVEIEHSEIHKLTEFNKKHRKSVVANGYPTIAKVEKNKVHYYKGPRDHKNMMAWIMKKTQKNTRRKQSRKRRTQKRKN